MLTDMWEALVFWGPQGLGKHWERGMVPNPGDPDNARVSASFDHTFWLRQWWDTEGYLHSEMIDYHDADLSDAMRYLNGSTEFMTRALV